jgi:hypothetical protein
MYVFRMYRRMILRYFVIQMTEYLKLAPFAQIDKRFANIQRMSINPPFLLLMIVIYKIFAANSL